MAEGGCYGQCLGGCLRRRGVTIRTHPLRESVAGWARASAWRLTPAISVEFGLYSCTLLDRNKEFACTRRFGIQHLGEQEALQHIHSYLRWQCGFQKLRMKDNAGRAIPGKIYFKLSFHLQKYRNGDIIFNIVNLHITAKKCICPPLFLFFFQDQRMLFFTKGRGDGKMGVWATY